MTDRYTKIVLTVIAGALVYLCIVVTAFPAVQAQGTPRAGEMINKPIDAVIVGWRVTDPLAISASRPLPVQTERASGLADRVVIVGWEEGAARDRAVPMTAIAPARGHGIPVQTLAR